MSIDSIPGNCPSCGGEPYLTMNYIQCEKCKFKCRMPEWNLLSIKINDQPDEWSENMTDQERITYWSTECVKVKAALAKLEIQTEIERRAMKRESGEESGWVIELAASEPCSPQYWAGSSLWVPEHLKALRFARKQDAQQAADFMLDGMKIRICEHGWS